ncbi:MAG: hypothetical protein DCF19_00635 [Pseudanabaena frigida]|uniref:SPOR domain-containing protein n=1 Tax=Pseudanabaena frigida TaxID=945775 RepID=A0A2W4YE20_9CYAN|nr:MAG: hypothetical protein DCF19_00635 [Pseudanabaena frigida]
MRSLRLSSRSSWAIATSYATSCLCITSLALVDSLIGRSIAIAAPAPQQISQSVSIPANNCPQLTNRRYVVLVDRPANSLPQLPEFLAIAAVPCSYLSTSMTFFGGFDNAKSSTFRASQLRELGLDAIVHSFSAKVNDVPANLQAAAVLVEPNNDPNMTIQQVRSLTSKSAFLATFNNRSVILAAPLSSQQSANAIATLLRKQGLAAQVISASLIASPNSAPSSIPATADSTSTPNKNPVSSKQIIYRVLVPNANSNTLKQLREIAPDAFVTIFKAKSYIQVRTYTNRGNAQRERERLNTQYSGTILIQD